MSISFVVAMDCNRAIGLHNQLPWHLPADLKYFRQLTTDHTVLMGRKTYESIGKPLPNRHNIILTHRSDFVAPGCEIVHSLEEVLPRYVKDELFVIGGAEVYRTLLPYATRLYITSIQHSFSADTYFPDFQDGSWHIISEMPGEQNEKNPYAYTFLVFEKLNS